MKLAVVRVRGNVRIKSQIRDALIMLNLRKKNHLVVVEDTPQMKGMLKKVSSFITWGPADEKLAGLKGVAKLNPPRKGYGRKGVKMAVKNGGAVGDRKDKMMSLVARMK